MKGKKREKELIQEMKKISAGFALTLIVVAVLFICSNDVLPAEVFLYESMPLYTRDESSVIYSMFNINERLAQAESETDGETRIAASESSISSNTVTEYHYEDENEAVTVIGTNDVVYETDIEAENEYNIEDIDFGALTVPYTAEQLSDFEFLVNNFYVSDSNTILYQSDIDFDKYLNGDFSLSDGDGPKVLIFHTHSTEMYADSDSSDINEGIVGVGAYLAELLQNKYGIETLHYTARFDIVEGQSHILGAYDRMNPEIEALLEANPSIEVVIDMHRDALGEGSVKLVTEVNGKQTARIMFVNGLSRLYENGTATELSYLPNENLSDNLAFSFNLQIAANSLFPGFTRKIYLKPYRYSPHLAAKAVLVEVGADSNTKQEALNAMEPFAEVLANVILK